MEDRRPDGKIEPPFSPPDCPFRSISPGVNIPENAVQFGKLMGDPVYLGRIYDDECWLVGTAVPSKGLCYFLSKDGQLKSTDSYDILTSDCGNVPLEFQPANFESRLLFISGGDDERLLYAAEVVDGENTYIGWVDKSVGIAHLPRDPSFGPNKVKENFKVLIHKLLDRLCVCPMPPPHSY